MSVMHPLLIELFTEELPPKALERLGQSFASTLETRLQKAGLLAEGNTVTAFATPLRLAVRLSAVREQAPDSAYSEKLMPVSVGLTPTGEASPALLKKLAAKGLEQVGVDQLVRQSDGKTEQLFYEGIAPGANLRAVIQDYVDDALSKLPIPKVMSYQLDDGETTVKFVRPAHGLVALWGEDVLPISVLGLTAGRSTKGHRFQSRQAEISLPHANDYEQLLESQGQVMASFTQRRSNIEAQLRQQAAALGASLGNEEEVTPLLNEVTALVEYPTVYVGKFDAEFLAVPQECLILTMRLNQKYFPLFESDGQRLTNQFLIVSNMRLDDPSNIVEGNQRVVRPRLADAQFFFETDKKQPLDERVGQLASVVYHNKLGSQLARAERIAALAAWVGRAIQANPEQAQRAARLAKADLVTGMVGEFPELQGLMGAYYAEAHGEPAGVVRAIREQYRIRLDEAINDGNDVAAALFIAERAETLLGIWSIGLAPTGDKDPYALRRAALGLISAFEQLAAGGRLSGSQALTLNSLLAQAAQQFQPAIAESVQQDVRDFIYERYRNQLSNQFDRQAVDAVLAIQPPLAQVSARVEAVLRFYALPEAASLAAANKRIGNLLKKVENPQARVQQDRLVEPAEKTLYQAIATLAPQVDARVEAGDFTGALTLLSQVHATVDAFFADVMVMAEDPAIRTNRLALLAELHQMMNRVADLSRLATS
ncbi:MAG: glycine--tRNA ligase subunit beta [Pigmentiphaga sp.]|nr:glycine--tRNA ligase subunit beta [Pigmentiphaga sp.]